MKKFVGLVALGLVAWFVALPAPAAAHHVGRFGDWGPRATGI
jgi:hypothetical protein